MLVFHRLFSMLFALRLNLRDRKELNITVVEEESRSDFEDFSAAESKSSLCKEKSSIDEWNFPSRSVTVIFLRSLRDRKEINVTVVEEESRSGFEDFSAADSFGSTCKGKSSIDEWNFPSRSVVVIFLRSLRLRQSPGMEIVEEGGSIEEIQPPSSTTQSRELSRQPNHRKFISPGTSLGALGVLGGSLFFFFNAL